VPLPSLSAQDRSAALEKAAQARRTRAAVKASLRSGSRTLADVLDDGDTVVARTKVVDILESLPGVGPVRAARIMRTCEISPTRRLRGLGQVQRAALIHSIGR
jgi:hypothetical protein